MFSPIKGPFGGSRPDLVVNDPAFGPFPAPGSIDMTIQAQWNAAGVPTSVTLYSAQGPSNNFRLYMDASPQFNAIVRNSGATFTPQNIARMGIGNNEYQFRYVYDAVAFGDHYLLPRFNGVTRWPGNLGQGGPSGPPLKVPYGGYAGSDHGLTPWTYPIDSVVSAAAPHIAPIPEFVAFGDSTWDYHVAFWKSVSSAIYTQGQRWTRPGIFQVAQGGSRVSDQKAYWQNSACDYFRSSPTLKAALFGGMAYNDIKAGLTGAQVLTALQDLIDTVKTDNPAIKVVVGGDTPKHLGFSAAEYIEWLAYNAGLAALTSVDAIADAYVATLSTGAGYLAAIYEVTGLGDGIHENDLARDIIGAENVVKLQGLGLLP